MKKTNKIVSGVMAASMAFILTTGGSAFASEDVHELSTTPPASSSSDGISIYGANPPSSSASTHNVSVSDYNYQVSKVGYRVYTDKWLTGASSIEVTVKNWTVTSDYGGTSDKLTVAVHNSSGNVVDSETIDTDNISSVTLTGLTKTSKYYVSFTVPNNGNTYSFNGAISN